MQYISDNPAENPPRGEIKCKGIIYLYATLLKDIADKMMMETDKEVITTLLKLVRVSTGSVNTFLSEKK